jgi:hypothetical protein
MSLIRKLRSYFFQNTGTPGVRFRKYDKPTEQTFSELFESTGFIAEKSDTATGLAQGFTKLASDSSSNSLNSTPDVDGFAKVVQPHQLPSVVKNPLKPLTGVNVLKVVSGAGRTGGTGNEYQVENTMAIAAGPTPLNPIIVTQPNPGENVLLDFDFTNLATQAQIAALVAADLNDAKKNEINVFQFRNIFNKRVSLAYSPSLLNIALSPGTSKAVVFPDDGNYFKLGDAGAFLSVDAFNQRVASPVTGENIDPATPITILITANMTLNHNSSISPGDLALGYFPIFLQNLTALVLEAGDYIQIVFSTNQWNVTGLFKKNPATTNITTLPVTGLSYSCLTVANNQLDTILQAIIDKTCSTVAASQNLFTSRVPVTYAAPIASSVPSNINPISFGDDIEAPYFDIGNNFRIDRYVIPASVTTPMRFIVENLLVTTGASAVSSFQVDIIRLNSLGVYVSTLASSTSVNIPATTTHLMSYLQTALVLFNTGDQIVVHYSGSSDLSTINQSSRFLNSFT